MDFDGLYSLAAQKPGHPNLSETIYRAEQDCPHTHRADCLTSAPMAQINKF